MQRTELLITNFAPGGPTMKGVALKTPSAPLVADKFCIKTNHLIIAIVIVAICYFGWRWYKKQKEKETVSP